MKYTVRNSETGQKITFNWTGSEPPTDSEMEEVFASAKDFKPAISPEPTSPQQTAISAQPSESMSKYGPLGAAFPATTRSTERGGGFLSRAVAGAGDVLTLPARGGAALGAGLGTLAGGGKLGTALKTAGSELGKTESGEKGALGFVQNMALDPTSSPLLLGGGIAAKGAKGALSLGKAAARTIASGAATGAGSNAYQQAKEGEISAGQTAGQAAFGAGLGAAGAGLGGAAKKAAGGLLKSSAIRNIDIALRPGQYGRKIGYNHENVVKHDLIGSPRETYEKATVKLDALQKRAKEIAGESDQTFNISELFDDVKSKIDPARNPEEYARQIELIDNAKTAYTSAFGEIVDAPTAMKIRTKIGEKSAFVGRTSGGSKVDPDADWKEDVYNDLYMKMKNELHGKLGGELQAINKAQSEIIPVKQVAERRMPIAESNQRIGLSDLMTAGVGTGAGATYAALQGDDGAGTGAMKALALGAGLAAGRRALGSPAATRTFYQLGSKLEKPLGLNRNILIKKVGKNKP
jgi:hypothetical protein